MIILIRGHHNNRSRILEYQLMPIKQLLQCFLREIKVVTVTNGHLDIQAAGFIAAIVHYGTAPNGAVGQGKMHPVYRYKASQEEAYFLYGAISLASNGYKLTRPDGSQHQQHHSGCDVLQGIL